MSKGGPRTDGYLETGTARRCLTKLAGRGHPQEMRREIRSLQSPDFWVKNRVPKGHNVGIKGKN